MRKFPSVSLAVLIGLGAAAGAAMPGVSQAQISIGISVGFPPPALPIYDQPPIPGYGYIWTPGYWSWDEYYNDYYWVPGTWVRPPRIGFLWTPGYWGFRNGLYLFNQGYWGQNIGYYGGIDYGFGYGGNGYEGGYWRGNDFFYNRNANNVRNVNIVNVYSRTVINNTTINHVSYNGGVGGVRVQPTQQQLMVARQPHFQPTAIQVQHRQLAATTPSLRASVNHGAPPIAATARPNIMRGPGVVAAVRPGAPYRPPTNLARPGALQPGARPGGQQSVGRPSPLQPTVRPAPNFGGSQTLPPRGQPNFRPNATRPPNLGPNPAMQHQGPGPQARPYTRPAPYSGGPANGEGMRPNSGQQPHPQAQFRPPPPQQQFRASPQQQMRAPPQQQFRAPPQQQQMRAPPQQQMRAQPQARPAPQAKPAPQNKQGEKPPSGQ